MSSTRARDKNGRFVKQEEIPIVQPQVEVVKPEPPQPYTVTLTRQITFYPSPFKRSDKVAIVGFAPSWVEAPFEDNEWEIWTLNEAYKLADQLAQQKRQFRVDRWFEIHDPYSASKNNPQHHKFLRDCPVPLFLQKHYPEFPRSVPFPLEQMLKFYEDMGCTGTRYHVCSISYMLALALYEGYREVGIYGVDLATSSEYHWQRPSVEFWLGLLDGLGIKLIIPETCDLLKCTDMYGFQTNNKNRVWIREQVAQLQKRIQVYAQHEDVAQKNARQALIAQAECRGAMAAYTEILRRSQT